MSDQGKNKTLSLGGSKLAVGGGASARGTARGRARPVQVEVVKSRTNKARPAAPEADSGSAEAAARKTCAH